jgi:nitroimidazol reductase NimA-like FMN-containing flavoprotein (pyridoxamine 5'-phosphate oxidase superfamily)
MLGELSSEEIENILATNAVGRLGCSTQQKMYVVPVMYVYDGEFIIGHTVEGMKVNMLRQNPECCFEVDVMKDMANWQSVIAWGTFEELTGEDANQAMEKLVNKLSPDMPAESKQPSRMSALSSQRVSTFTNNPIVYRIRLKEKTGRFERY